jgi:hypothetical protein
VVLQFVYRNLGGREMTAVAFDLFRFKDGRIIEHWDSLEPGIKVGIAGLSQVNGARDVTDLAKSDTNRKLVLSFIDNVLVAGKTERTPSPMATSFSCKARAGCRRAPYGKTMASRPETFWRSTTCFGCRGAKSSNIGTYCSRLLHRANGPMATGHSDVHCRAR